MEVNEGDPAGAANLEKIDHVVVVMLENRSFDHILGYLPLSGGRPEIDGLHPGLANEYQGRAYPVHHLAATAVQMDPDHSASAIDRQIANGTMSGFVASAAATLATGGVEDGDPGRVMGYYDGADVDVRYRLGHHDRFGYFSKTGLPWKTVFDITVNPKIPSFLEDAAAGTLRQVSWIDPAFTNFNPLGFPVNDDHPPADIKDGQDLVLAVYDALASSPQWDRSLLVVVYDENGGFYDHVPPPQAADDQPEMFGRYGVRVPAIIVSPWIEPRTVSHTLFDHTSIIKTILLRFCPGACDPLQAQEKRPRLSRSPGYPGLRVTQASHLGELLTRATARPAARCPGAAGRGQDRPNSNRAGRGRSGRTGQPSAQRPAEKHPCRVSPAKSRRAPAEHAIDGHVIQRSAIEQNGCRQACLSSSSPRPSPGL